MIFLSKFKNNTPPDKGTSLNYNFVNSNRVSTLVNNEMRYDSDFHPNLGGVTRGGMSNHFPMTVMSLSELGASDDEVHNFCQRWPRYRAHVTEDLGLLDRRDITLNNWTEFLGDSTRLLEFQRVFLQGVTDSGSLEFTSLALEKMMLSLPMGLFHPLIQLSFALLHGDHKLIANALAYFAIRYKNLYRNFSLLAASEDSSVMAESVWFSVDSSLSEANKQAYRYSGSLAICEYLCSQDSVKSSAFDKGFCINRDNIKDKIAEISLLSVRLYLSEPALTTLHAVTSCQALADITLRCSNVDNVDTYIALWSLYWIWLTGLYLEKGSLKSLPDSEESKFHETSKGWDQISHMARNIPEVHLIKMVYSCKWLFENIQQNEIYRIVCLNVLSEGDAHPNVIKWAVNTPLRSVC